MEGTELEIMFRVRGPRYALPEYQRGYSWKTDHVEQFLQDLEDAGESGENHQHFFGYMLTAQDRNLPERVVKIIDGQQRMTTATLFLICARNFFYTHREKSELSKRHFENLEERLYTSSRAGPDLNRPILTLSRANSQLFIDLCRRENIGKAPPSNFRKTHDSNVLLYRAYRTIQAWLVSKTRERKNGTAGEGIEEAVLRINEYVLTLFGKFVVQRSHYEDQDEAYEIFNLVNSRGVSLADSDLIKSYLFGEFLRPVGDETGDDPQNNMGSVEHYDDRWNEMRINVTGKDKASYKDLNRFLAHYLVAFNSPILPTKSEGESRFATQRPTQKQMHDAFKHMVKSMTPAEIIDDLHKWSAVMVKLRNPGDVAEFKRHVSLIHYLRKIRDIDAVYAYPIILAGYAQYWDSGQHTAFEALVMACFKYHVRAKMIASGVPLPRYEQAMHKITKHINEGISLGDIIKYLINEPRYYPTDDDAIGPLERLHLRTPAHIVAVLEEAEYSGAEKPDRGDVTVEHIMPKSFEAWEDYIANNNGIETKDPRERKKEAKKLHEDNFDCLGNLTLLSGKDNQAAATKPLEGKLKEYEKHQTYKITKSLLTEKVWSVERIKKRKKRLAKAILEEIDLRRILDSLEGQK